MCNALDVIFVGTLPPHPGGSAVSCAEFLPILASMGHRIRAITPTAPLRASGQDPFRHPAIPVVTFDMPFYYMEPNVPPPDEYRERERVQVEAALLRAMGERPADVILMGRESFVTGVVPAALRHGVPCVLRLAGSQIEAVAAGRFPPAITCEFRRLLGGVDRVVAQAAHVRAVAQEFGCRELITIPNAVDLQRFRPRRRSPALARELNLRGNAKIVMHASNLKQVKRPLDVLLSAAAVCEQVPDAYYVIVGDGPLLGSMQQLASEKALSARVRFTGWVSHDRMPALLNLADLVVMPSELEQQAGVYLETQACARVLLASDIPGAREVIEDGVSGVLFRVRDAGDLARKTIALLTDATLRARIGRQARERVRRHEIHAVTRQHSEALLQAAACRKPRRSPSAAISPRAADVDFAGCGLP